MEGLTELFPMHKQTVLRWNNLSVTFCVDRTTDQTPFHRFEDSFVNHLSVKLISSIKIIIIYYL